MTPPKTSDCNSDAMASFAAPPGSATDELATLKAENERLKDIVRKCNRDWYRLKDFIIGCNGPGEMIRFQEAARKNNGKGVEMFLSYLDSLWRELDKAKSPNVRTERPEA